MVEKSQVFASPYSFCCLPMAISTMFGELYVLFPLDVVFHSGHILLESADISTDNNLNFSPWYFIIK